MATHRTLLCLGILVVAGAAWFALADGTPPPRRTALRDDLPATAPAAPAGDREPGPTPAVAARTDVPVPETSPAGDAARTDVPARSSPAGDADPDSLGMWQLQDARRDEHGLLVDLRPYLHESIDKAFADTDDAKTLKVASWLRTSEVNPARIGLTADDQQQLETLLASHRSTMDDVGPLAHRKLAAAFHQAIERGEMYRVGANGEGVQETQARILGDLTARFGQQGREYVYLIAAGPCGRDANGRIRGDSVDQYVLAVHRAMAPEAFAARDEVRRQRDDAKRVVREYLASRR